MKTYSLNIKRQILSYRNGLLAIPYFLVALTYLYLSGETENFFDASIIIGILIFHTICSIPAIILHSQYYKENRSLIVNIDKQQDLIEINNNNQDFSYKISELKIKKVLQQEFRFKGWERAKPIPWLDYGYLRIETPNGLTFNLTSLMIELNNPYLKESDTKYKVIPFLEKSLSELRLEQEEQNSKREKLIKKYKRSYLNLPLEQIKKIANGNDFQEEAKLAAKEILNEKNTTYNRVNCPTSKN